MKRLGLFTDDFCEAKRRAGGVDFYAWRDPYKLFVFLQDWGLANRGRLWRVAWILKTVGRRSV